MPTSKANADQNDPERRRLQELVKIEKAARREGYKSIAGIDEAGRGPLAGPVVAAACVIPANLCFIGINDSKQLTPLKRKSLFEEITHHPKVAYAVGIISQEEIDSINIYQATIQAMLQAVQALISIPDLLLVDGMNLPHPAIPCRRIVGGDALVHCIAAASVVAKETRDRLMVEYHSQWPEYGFDQHKGYGTAQHMEAIQKHGPCPIHRRSFAPFKEGVAKLQFGDKSALLPADARSAQVAYLHPSMSTCAESEPLAKSSNLASKASFSTPSKEILELQGATDV
ncbi:MAG: ribonuclease HII [Parachlamydia sp.]|nr:ribonuclease HII [Parachlamydia sp.]